MIAKVSSEFVPLTRKLALEFDQMRPLPGERLLRPTRLHFFASRLDEGTFNSPTWAKVLVGSDLVPYRADGQHTSKVLATCEEPVFPVGLSVTVDTWRVDSTDELGDLFDLFNNPVSARTNVDKMGVFVASYEDLQEVDRGFLAKVAHGINYFYRTEPAPANSARPAQLFTARDYGLYFNKQSHRQFALWLHPFNGAIHGWMLGKPGIVAEMFNDWSNFPNVADVFWNLVFRESHPDQEDDTRELVRTFADWSHKKPAMKQEKYRIKAQKYWERFRRAVIAQPEILQPRATTTEQPAA